MTSLAVVLTACSSGTVDGVAQLGSTMSSAPASDSTVAVSSPVVSSTLSSSLPLAPTTSTPSPSPSPVPVSSAPVSSLPVSSVPVVPNASPAPTCYPTTCPALASAELPGGGRVVLANPDPDHTVAILLRDARPFDQLSMRALGQHPRVTCLAPSGAMSCLMSGVPGAHTAFGRMFAVANGRLAGLSSDIFGEGGLELAQITADTLIVTGIMSFSGYGLSYAASPSAWHTWTLRGRTFSDTGCGVPSFSIPAKAPTSPQTGACTGTPAMPGYPVGTGPALDLTQGIVSTSGNLWCGSSIGADGPSVFCTISKTDFTVPPCSTGQPGVIVSWIRGARPALSDCQGDIMIQFRRNPISYGQLAFGHGFGCVISASGGVRCTDGTGHGFVLARAGYSTV